MIDGGMICPSVPDAATMPPARRSPYPARSSDGSAITVSVATDAPTTPVEAASTPPTSTTATPRPPGTPRKQALSPRNSACATPACWSRKPMRMNSGIASSIRPEGSIKP